MKYTCTFRDDVDQQVWSGKGDTRASHKAVIFVCLQECFRHMKIDGCAVDGFFQSGLYYSEREEWILDLMLCACMHACMRGDGWNTIASTGGESFCFIQVVVLHGVSIRP